MNSSSNSFGLSIAVGTTRVPLDISRERPEVCWSGNAAGTASEDGVEVSVAGLARGRVTFKAAQPPAGGIGAVWPVGSLLRGCLCRLGRFGHYGRLLGREGYAGGGRGKSETPCNLEAFRDVPTARGRHARSPADSAPSSTRQ